MTCQPLSAEEAAKLQAHLWPKRQAYVFMVKRPVDREEWPAIYTHPDLAEAAFGRVSPVRTVDFDAEVATPEQRAELVKTTAESRATYDMVMIMEAGYANPLAPMCGALLDLVESLLEERVKL